MVEFSKLTSYAYDIAKAVLRSGVRKRTTRFIPTTISECFQEQTYRGNAGRSREAACFSFARRASCQGVPGCSSSNDSPCSINFLAVALYLSRRCDCTYGRNCRRPRDLIPVYSQPAQPVRYSLCALYRAGNIGILDTHEEAPPW